MPKYGLFHVARTNIFSLSSHMKSNRMPEFLKSNYNVAAIVCGLLSLLLVIFFIKAKSPDINLTYYLISVSAIYSTIQLGFLLQKLLTIRQQKEHLLTGYNDLWESVTHYRYLCALAESYLDQHEHHQYRRARALKAERSELLAYNFTGNKKDIETTHLKELINSKLAIKYALLVKQLDFFTKDVYRHVNYNNRVFANNNQTINAYIKGMIEDPVFSLIQELPGLPELESLLTEIAKHSFYMAFQTKAGFEGAGVVLENMVKIERYLLNQVLFKLHDHTFIIERPLPQPFKHLLLNSLTILICGTILPLFNAFFALSPTFTWICGALTLAALVLSITYVALTFYDENNDALYQFIPIVYEGKEK